MDEQIINKPLNGWDYPDSNRIFYQTGYEYDFVTNSTDATIDQKTNEGVVSLKLLSGKESQLHIGMVNNAVIKLHFDNSIPNSELSDKEYIQSEFNKFLEPTLGESDEQFVFQLDEVKVVIDKSPFCLQVLKNDKLIFKTSTKKISHQWITPGLGQRVDSKGCRQAFMSWDINNGDAFYGLGEKFGRVEKSQTHTVSFAMDADGSNSTDLSYKDYPVLLSTSGYGLMMATARQTKWDIGDFCYSSNSVLTESPILNTYIFMGSNLKQLVSQESLILGRPQLPAPWTLGIWYSRCAYQSREELEGISDKLKKYDLPFDVLHIDVQWGKNYWYPKYWVDCCDFEWDYKDWPEPQKMLSNLWKNGVATSIWLNPYLPPQTAVYDEALEKGYLVKTIDGGIAHVTRRVVSDVGIPDLTNPKAYLWWKNHVKDLLKMGIKIIKPDYTDRIPDDALFFNGFTGKDMHNMYINLYVKACYEATQEVNGSGLVWKRPGFLGTTKYAGTWSGDVESTFEGMKFTLRGALSVGFAGEILWSSDIAGFKGKDVSKELYIRWSQWGLLCSLSRYHGVSPREPWYYGDQAVDVVRRYSKLRYKLAPYYLQTTLEATRTGVPVMRHLALEFPEDRIAQKIDDEFMIGSSLLVVPVVESGITSRQLYLPEGNWYEINSKKWYKGQRTLTLPVTLNDIPVFVREGSVLPEFKNPIVNLKSYDNEPILLVKYGESNGDIKGSLIDENRGIHSYEIKNDKVVTDYPAEIDQLEILQKGVL